MRENGKIGINKTNHYETKFSIVTIRVHKIMIAQICQSVSYMQVLIPVQNHKVRWLRQLQLDYFSLSFYIFILYLFITGDGEGEGDCSRNLDSSQVVKSRQQNNRSGLWLISPHVTV